MKKLLFSLIFLCHLAYASSVEEALSSIPFKDRVEMGYFFRLMIQQDQLAHVLFFDTKPAILTAYSKSKNKNFQDKLILKGWKAWKKWEFLFPHSNFIFCEDDAGFDGWEVVHILIANKQTLRKCLNDNKDIFQNILGNAFSPESFILGLEQTKQLYPLINHNDALLGIILGFGRESSITYQNFPDNENFDKHAIADKIQGRYFPVSFRGDPNSEEVTNLLQKYRDEGKKYLGFSRHKNLLKLSLAALTQCY